MHLIKNGTVVTPVSMFKADVLVKDGIIQAIGKDLCADGVEIIDAEGKYVLPGAIDVHTHMALPFGGTIAVDDFAEGTKSAAFGGITTIIDFAIQPKGQSLAETVAKRREEADSKVYIDYGLHVAITDLTDAIMEEMIDIIKDGIPTFKLFMTYPGLAVDDYTLFHALKKASENGGMIGVHAENMNLIVKNTEALLARGYTEPYYHAVSRPEYVESEAIGRAIMWAAETGSKLYVVHLSTEKGLNLIKDARSRGEKVLCETCPQYLLLTEESYKEPGFAGAKYVMSPPLRHTSDNEALWEGLSSGDVQWVGSDHCPFTMEQKGLGKDSFAKIPNGAPGVETSLMLLYSEGVRKGRITLNKLVEVLCYNPSKLFGLSSKGAVEVGKDADIVLLDPDKKMTLSVSTLHSLSDYTPFDGLEVTGVPVMTMSKGKIICDNGVFKGENGWGKYLKRKL